MKKLVGQNSSFKSGIVLTNSFYFVRIGLKYFFSVVDFWFVNIWSSDMNNQEKNDGSPIERREMLKRMLLGASAVGIAAFASRIGTVEAATPPPMATSKPPTPSPRPTPPPKPTPPPPPGTTPKPTPKP